MSVKCQVIIEALERLAPRRLAEEWDQVGLQLGSPAQDIHGILVTLDLTEAALEEAKEKGANLIVCHHPLIFKPVAQIRTDLPQGKLLTRLLKEEIAVYVAHTNLDIAAGGVNDVLARRLGLKEVNGLSVTGREKLVKIVVFVPKTHEEKVAEAMMKAGAGHIGNYSCCTFRAAGVGSFLAHEDAKPYLGRPGKMEMVEEIRLETIMPELISRRVVRAMLAVHPYEEVAYDLYSLENEGRAYTLGRIGALPETMEMEPFLSLVKTALQVDRLRFAGGQSGKMICKVAVCGGSGASLIGKAAFAGADAFITGDVKYHEAQSAETAGVLVVDAGHFATEWPVVASLSDYLTDFARQAKWRLEVTAGKQKDVFDWI